MTTQLAPILNGPITFIDNNGNFIAGGKIYSYEAGSFSVQQPTYTNNTGTTANANPLVMNSSGKLNSEVWLDDSLTYNFVVTLSDGITVVGSYNNVKSIATPVTAVTADQVTYTPPFTGGVATTGTKKYAQIVSFNDFGGSTSNTSTQNATALATAKTYCDSKNAILYFDGGTYLMTGTVTLPNNGVMGNCVLSGGTVLLTLCKNPQIIGSLTCSTMVIDSVWSASFESITTTGNLTIQSTNTGWGTFWNQFGNMNIGGTLIINCDGGQSINQNTFGNVKCAGGLHIAGVNTTGVREAYNNIFQSLDSSGGNLTAVNGSTGWQVLNDSNLNETNTIQNWDAETSGNEGISGNWNVLSSNVDSNTCPLAITDRNHFLFSSTQNARNDGDFLASGNSNAALGGQWDVLEVSGSYPACFYTFGTCTTGTTYGATYCPSQINKEWPIATSSLDSGFQVNFNFNEPQTVVLYMWYKGDDFASIASDGGSYTNGIPFVHSSGWKLLRCVVPTVTGSILFYMNASSASAKNTSINSIFATNTKTALMPTKQPVFNVYTGVWNPVLSNFTIVLGTTPGTVTTTGSFVKMGTMLLINVKIVCAAGATVAAVVGTSSVTGFPAAMPIANISTGTWANATTLNTAGTVLMDQSNNLYITSGTWSAATDTWVLSVVCQTSAY